MNQDLIKYKNQLQTELSSISNSMFEIKTANQFIENAKKRPILRMLFGEKFFISEGTVSSIIKKNNI
ncbi:MAG TPA: hypothetical protein VLZ11_00945 [Flavobacterium sp.]|nr:hypothetical protein [Flavobacterium sp.]